MVLGMDSANSPPLFSLHCNCCEKYLGKIDNQTQIVYCRDCYKDNWDDGYDSGYNDS